MNARRVVQGLFVLLSAIVLVELYRSSSWGRFDVGAGRSVVASLGSLGWSMLVVGAFLATLLLIPLSPIGFVAGALYGFLPALGALMTGGLVAVVVGFYAARHGVARTFTRWLGRHSPKGAEPGSRPDRNWVRLVFLLRVLPVIPFGSATYLLAFSRVPLADYVVGSALGLAPVALLSAWLGSRAVFLESPADVLDPEVWIPGLLLLILFGLGFVFQSRWHLRRSRPG